MHVPGDFAPVTVHSEIDSATGKAVSLRIADNSPRTLFAAEVPDRYDTQVLSIPLVKDLQSISEKLRELTHFQLRTYIMFRLAICIYVALTCVGVVQAQENKNPDSISTQLEKQQYDLSTGGKTFLLDEARKASFFLLGELHGENEIPALLRELWPQMWPNGYRNIAAEVSPWAAHQLEFAPVNGEFKIQGLWSKDEAQLFDLRPLRSILHQIPDKDRSSVQKSLVYWADSYDAIICYREVTPLESISKTYQ